MRVRRVFLLAIASAGCGLSVEGLAIVTGDDAGTPVQTTDAMTTPILEAAADDDTGTPPVDAAPDVDQGVDAGPAAKTALLFGGAPASVRMTRPVQDDFTLEAWIKSTDPGGAANGNFFDGPPIWHSDTPGPSNDFGSSILDKKLAFGTGMPDTAVLSTSDVATGQWVHVAAVRVKSTGTVAIFVNGAQEATKAGLNTASLGQTPTMDIGGNFGNVHFFNGAIDEVRAWSVARTAQEIQATMHTRLTGNEQNLVGYWRFDEGAGVTAIDSSPTKKDATLGNGDAGALPTWVPSTAF